MRVGTGCCYKHVAPDGALPTSRNRNYKHGAPDGAEIYVGHKTISASPQRRQPPNFAKRLECVLACWRFLSMGRPSKAEASFNALQTLRDSRPAMLAEPFSVCLLKYALSNILLMSLFGQTYAPGRNLSSHVYVSFCILRFMSLRAYYAGGPGSDFVFATACCFSGGFALLLSPGRSRGRLRKGSPAAA